MAANVVGVVVASRGGKILLSRYGSGSTREEALRLEQELRLHTLGIWQSAKGGFPTGPQFLVLGENRYVSFVVVGELVLFVCGENEIDEIILHEIIEPLTVLLQMSVNDTPTEAVFLTPDCYGKFVVLLDEMLSQGYLEFTDPEQLARLVKLKSL